MVLKDEGPSPAALAMALAALVTAGVSFGLATGSVGESAQRRTADPSSQSLARKYAQSYARQYERVVGPVRTLAPADDPSGNDVGSSSALCASGKRAVSGGYQTITGGGETFYSDALTQGRVGWAVAAVNNLARSGTVQAYAYCVGSGRVNSRKLARQRAAAIRQIETLVDRYRAVRSSQRSGAGGL